MIGKMGVKVGSWKKGSILRCERSIMMGIEAETVGERKKKKK